MKKPLILLALVAACGASDRHGDQTATGASPRVSAEPASLTGLYEGGAAGAPNQLCVVDKGGTARFGIVTWGPNLGACGGAGVVEREGDRLRFRMTGDQACTIEARLVGGSIRLESKVPSGCSYYCAPQAGFEGASFARRGSTIAEAMKAKDPAGDPLCSG
jgi:hypothetical protein